MRHDASRYNERQLIHDMNHQYNYEHLVKAIKARIKQVEGYALD